MDITNKLVTSKKIAIFGWPATGKSTFAKVLSDKLNIDLYSLDLIRWKYSKDGIKDDDSFFRDYEKILEKDSWIIEGNALDFIDSRLKNADVLIFFDSTIEECISNYNRREDNIRKGLENRINFDESKSMDDTVSWIKNRYSKKIEKLRLILPTYEDKLIVVNNYCELDCLIKEIDIL